MGQHKAPNGEPIIRVMSYGPRRGEPKRTLAITKSAIYEVRDIIEQTKARKQSGNDVK